MDIQILQQQSLASVAQAANLEALEAARLEYLGKSGKVTSLLKEMGKLDPEQRQAVAPLLNELRDVLSTQIEEKKNAFELEVMNAKLLGEKIDVTLPAMPYSQGRLHPVSATMAELAHIMKGMGFAVVQGPEVTTDYYNFTVLNIPESHPARQDHDTFYLPKGENGEVRLLRTQTSNVQILAMDRFKPPFRIIAPGRVYRSDFDPTHTPQFHQMEGMMVDKNVTFAHLKGTLQYMLSQFFGKEIRLRLRPNHFPFTEPSVEIDVGAEVLGEEGHKISKGTGWIEVLGAGMVHPNVLKHGGVDPTQWQGFAFGCGIERLAMLKYGINDARLFFESHQSFLRHFGHHPAAQ